jgi:hypothetical protein
VVVLVSLCSFLLSMVSWHLANSICHRFLRARLPHERRHDPYHHHQRDGGGYDLARQEWEDSVLGFPGVIKSNNIGRHRGASLAR